MDQALEWPTREDARWSLMVLFAADRHGVPVEEVHDDLEVALAAVIDSGIAAEELFGTPEEHAQSLAEVVPAEVYDAAGTELLADVGTGTLFGVGALGLVATPMILLDTGWSVPVTPKGLGIVAVLVLGMALALGVQRWWRNGRLQAAAIGGAVGAVGLVGGVTASMSLPVHDRLLAQIPTAVVAVATVGSLWWGARRSNRRCTPAPTEVDAPTWFTLLTGLLRGRHHLSAQTTRDVVTQARQHVAASGARHPSQEFGTPETYARTIAAQTTESTTRGARRAWFLRLGATLLAGFVVIGAVVDGGTTWLTWVGAVGILAPGWDLLARRRDVGAAR